MLQIDYHEGVTVLISTLLHDYFSVDFLTTYTLVLWKIRIFLPLLFGISRPPPLQSVMLISYT